MMRSWLRHIAPCLLVLLAAPASAQRWPYQVPPAAASTVPSMPEVLSAWRRTAPDTAALRALVDSSLLWAATGARGMAEVVADTSMPTVSRLYALWGLEGFLNIWFCRPFFQYHNGYHYNCSDAIGMPEVDTRRYGVAYLARASIHPALCDSIRQMLVPIREEPDGMGFAVASTLPWLAPSERWSDTARRSCAASVAALQVALTVVDSLRPGPTDGWRAANYIPGIGGCNLSAPPVVALAWARTASDEASLTHLVGWSIVLRDQRVLDAALGAARDTTAPLSTRVAAIHAVGGLIHQGVAASVHTASRTQPFLCQPLHVFVELAPQEEGAVPVTDEAAATALATLDALFRSGSPEAVRVAAATTADCVRVVRALLPLPWR